jgi:hypothetical protein
MSDDNGEGVSHFGVSCLIIKASLDITSRQGFVRDASGSDIDLMTTLVATRGAATQVTNPDVKRQTVDTWLSPPE